MAANTRFAVALHALTALAWLGEARTSEELARGTVNTNPVVLRRILTRLVKAGMLEAHPGKKGGFRLARAPRTIDLAAVYRAVEGDEGLLGIHANPEVKSCPVSCAIRPVLDDVFREAEDALTRSLAGRRVSDVVGRIPSVSRGARA
jgi:Rrf2 family protein